jgi:glucose/mannose-6-phosphate isomerase
MTPHALTDHAHLKAHDPHDMIGAILGLPEQFEQAKRVALAADIGALKGKRFGSVVIAGLGGSAIGGDLLRAVFEPILKCPVVVVRDYDLPGFVDSDTLVIASSNSGNTEETLNAYAQARKAGAQILAATTGGKLDSLADADNVPCIALPVTGLQPRAALFVRAARSRICAYRSAAGIGSWRYRRSRDGAWDRAHRMRSRHPA